MSHRPPRTQGVWRRRCVRWDLFRSSRGDSNRVASVTPQFAAGPVLFVRSAHRTHTRPETARLSEQPIGRFSHAAEYVQSWEEVMRKRRVSDAEKNCIAEDR